MIFVVGMNHKTAPIDLREKVAVTDTRYHAFSAFLAGAQITEQVILSTCNRTEVYGCSPNPELAARQVVRAFAEFSGEPEPVFREHTYKSAGPDAVRHLFTVAAGLDSMALGETEILGQVKDAYAKAQAAKVTSRSLNALFQRALRVGKKVRTETPIGEGRVSIASIAVDLALKIFHSLGNKRVLLIGSGQMARAVCESLMGKGVKELVIVNRNAERAGDLAERFIGHARAVPFEDLDREAPRADIIISSAATPHAFIRSDRVRKWMEQKKRGAVFIIDLGVPRNAEEGVNELLDVYLYNLDNLQSIADQNAKARQAAVAACQTIIESAADQFIGWLEAGAGRAAKAGG